MREQGSGTGKLYRRILDMISADIVAGRHPIGTRLPAERDLAARFGVSRPVVREAIVVLELRGLVQVRKGSGVYVISAAIRPALDDLDIGAIEIIEARRLLEAEVAAVAATEIDDARLADLQDLLDDMAQPDPVAAEAADRRFHIVIAEATGNKVIVAAVTDLWDMRERSPLARATLAKAGSLGIQNRLREHGLILKALTERSPGAAREAMREHLDRVIDHLLSVAEDEEVHRVRATTAAHRKRLAQRSF